MLLKILNRWVQIRSPIKLYQNKEAILIETANEFTNMFGSNVCTQEFDERYRKACRSIEDSKALPFVQHVKPFVRRDPEI